MNKRDALKELIDDLSDPKEDMIITLYADKHARNVFAYLEDKYDQTPTQLINRALMGFYAEDIKELERKEE